MPAALDLPHVVERVFEELYGEARSLCDEEERHEALKACNRLRLVSRAWNETGRRLQWECSRAGTDQALTSIIIALTERPAIAHYIHSLTIYLDAEFSGFEYGWQSPALACDLLGRVSALTSLRIEMDGGAVFNEDSLDAGLKAIFNQLVQHRQAQLHTFELQLPMVRDSVDFLTTPPATLFDAIGAMPVLHTLKVGGGILWGGDAPAANLPTLRSTTFSNCALPDDLFTRWSPLLSQATHLRFVEAWRESLEVPKLDRVELIELGGVMMDYGCAEDFTEERIARLREQFPRLRWFRCRALLANEPDFVVGFDVEKTTVIDLTDELYDLDVRRIVLEDKTFPNLRRIVACSLDDQLTRELKAACISVEIVRPTPRADLCTSI